MKHLLTGHEHYYTVGRVKFKSKIEACIFATKVGMPVEWQFACHDTYSKYDWSVEPEHSLDYYYDKRAREIREKYDYVIIAYSGGADSHNMLTSFVRQGLHVDEIFVAHVNKMAENTVDLRLENTEADNIEAEYVLNVLPKLRAISNRIPATKITCVDMSDRCINAVTEDSEGWVHTATDFRNVYNLRFDWFSNSDFRQALDKLNKNVCIVTGAEKPKTYIKDGVLYTLFNDIAYGSGTPLPYGKDYGYVNLTGEFFYWDNSTADLVCKQVHSIKKQLEANPELANFWDMGKIKNYRLVTTRIHERCIIPWIYTTWDNGFQTKKAVNGLWTTELDDFWRDIADDRQIELYDGGLKYLEEHAKDFVGYENGVPIGLKVCAKHYAVGQMKNLVKLALNN